MAAEPAGPAAPKVEPSPSYTNRTKLGDPIRPDSSAVHQAKRTLLAGWTLAICSAASRMAALPEPLSLMPGPGNTESRWAPTITTFESSPCDVSAVTLKVGLI